MNGRLDISHGAWHGSYATFAAWRVALVKAAQVVQPTTAYFVSTHKSYAEAMAMYFEREECVVSDPAIDDPLIVLLTHSPVEGTIAPEDCARVADRLAALIPHLEALEMQRVTAQFVAGCRWTAAEQSPLVFA